MSSQQQHSSNVAVSEVYWSLVKKADKKFSKIRDLPYYQRNRFLSFFSLFFVCAVLIFFFEGKWSGVRIGFR